MLKLNDLTQEDIKVIKRWPEYPPEFKELDYALRDGGWHERDFGRESSKLFSALEDGELIGFAGLNNVNGVSADFLIALRADKLGKGLGRELTVLVLNKCFFEYGLSSVSLVVRKNNVRAKMLYNRVGFRETGECVLEKNDWQIPFYEMSVSKEQFLQAQNY